MPAQRYIRHNSWLAEENPHREWPRRSVSHAPLWCSVDLRDGNQSLPNPMSPQRKMAMFNLLTTIGFKQIEVGYPASSEADFEFVRSLIHQDLVPDDVTISVFTPARIELIDRTIEAVLGADRAVIHLCLATACLWREAVLGMTAPELLKFTVDAAEHVTRRVAALGRTEIRLEYSPETFNVTEPEFALAVISAVTSTWDACPDRPVVVNLPSTVETDSPNVYADQIEWMHRNLDRRDSVILSVHPHNDRGCAVASAELAQMAGAERVEGTLFGNGERTGNVCLATLALNLFSRGIDPQLDFSDIDAIRGTVEFCNQLPVHPRHPYAGDLVYTAFSGQHQDGIAKGLARLNECAARFNRSPGDLPWEVPYLPIDPCDVGRSYESVIRVNSQSGKGGMAHVLLTTFGLDLPRGMRIEFARVVQKVTDETGEEINSRQLWEIFQSEYMATSDAIRLEKLRIAERDGQVHVDAVLALPDGGQACTSATAPTLPGACAQILASTGYAVEIRDVTTHPVDSARGEGKIAAYAAVTLDGVSTYSIGMAGTTAEAVARAIIVATGRILMRRATAP
jgi:2-isopropylmalate synthase